MTTTTSVQEYIALQPKLARRRSIMRSIIRFILFNILAKVEVRGLDNVIDDEPAILMMNHISLLDPILCMAAITNRFVIPMSKAENLRNPLLAPFIRWWGSYVVNRGEVDRKALVNSIELLKSGQLILIAPEGTRQTDGLAQPKDGLAYVATKADAVIIPAAIAGAMDWLDQLKRLRRPRIIVTFGRPFRFKLNGARVPREALSAMTEEAMYQLALALPDEALRGIYRDVSQATTDYLEFVR